MKIKYLLFILIIFCPIHPYDETWVTSIFNSLSLEEKIGQLIIAATVSDEVSNKPFVSTQPYHMDHEYVRALIEQYKVGGIIFLGAGKLEQQIAITNDFQQRAHVPLLIAQDLEWGLSQRISDAMVFPHAMTLGALHNPDLIYQMYKEVARQASLVGVHLILAPVVDVNNNAANP